LFFIQEPKLPKGPAAAETKKKKKKGEKPAVGRKVERLLHMIDGLFFINLKLMSSVKRFTYYTVPTVFFHGNIISADSLLSHNVISVEQFV